MQLDDRHVRIKAAWNEEGLEGWRLHFIDMETGKILPVEANSVTISYSGAMAPIRAQVTLFLNEIDTEVLASTEKISNE